MIKSLKALKDVAKTVVLFWALQANAQTDLYSIISDSAGSHIRVGTTSGDAPTYVNNNINQNTVDNSCVIQIRRWWTAYSISALSPNTPVWSNGIVVWSTQLLELDPGYSNTAVINEFKDWWWFWNSRGI